MQKVFIVRPFGSRTVFKKGDHQVPVNFDFDKVENELIKPAMLQLNLTGGTTGEIFEAGDIREDMFSDLLLADIVIADITVYNANVFYELGIRHALRDKITVPIKCPGFDDTPFDIIGYKYLPYDKDKPGEALASLIKFIQGSMDADRRDSPVFNVLPQLAIQEPEKYLALPKDFVAEVAIAEGDGQAGKLALMACEADCFQWRFPALRLCGEALYEMNALNLARHVWEKVKDHKPSDVQANDRLATIYQRLADAHMKTNPDAGEAFLTKSDHAIRILIEESKIGPDQRAEVYALEARNSKTRWIRSWKNLPEDKRSAAALQSIHLEESYRYYIKAFRENLNHYYAGINALGLLTTIIALSEKHPDIWESAYETKDEADLTMKEFKNTQKKLVATVQVSIEAAKSKYEPIDDEYFWLNITEADLACLTATKPARVVLMYSRIQQKARPFSLNSTIRQLEIYDALGVKSDNVKAVLAALPKSADVVKKTMHYLLFTGHMIDKADRKEPRFPASKEAAVRAAIKDCVKKELDRMGTAQPVMGIGGGACGGDLLFHEVCQELLLPSQVLLAVPEEQFVVESVAWAGNDWVDRFHQMLAKVPNKVLSDEKTLPKWLQKTKGYDIWTRNNLWELSCAMVDGGMNMTLIALWNGKGGDGPGGTEHMIKEARSKGARVITIDINTL